VPGYDGGLFSDDPDVNAAGAALAAMELTDSELGPALTAMLVDEGEDELIGPVDFRSLSVREFGTIYEGLLESMLSVAQSDLAVDAKGNYVPAVKGAEVAVAAGEVYFHNRSGARKTTGSYFTKPFAVEHLLDHALEPALNEHLTGIAQALDAGDDAAAADAFFDFRCADLAMGSGHFLVAAVDRIEARLSNFLALHPIPAVSAELETLRSAALAALGDLADGVEIETTSLLRRQVARRCIYGVDLNHISVELARLGIWIHTFVPGLPLSFLDHSLVTGNSLTGIGTVDEALEVLDPEHCNNGKVSLFRATLEEFLGRASRHLQRLGRIIETTAADIDEARETHNAALFAVAPARQLFDLLVAVRLGEASHPEKIDEQGLADHKDLAASEALATDLQALHFPIAFPEVFLRDRSGFDCILGNPPWAEVMVDEHSFWSLRSPGIRSLPAGRMRKEIDRLRGLRPDIVAEYDAEVAATDLLRATLSAGQYPQMNKGNADLYKAFCWRFWRLTRRGGAIGVVLPRTALSGAGTRQWRESILDGGAFTDVTILLNNVQWFFEDVHPQYTIGLVSVRKGEQFAGQIALRGPFASSSAYEAGRTTAPARFDTDAFRTWSDAASFPLLPSPKAVGVFALLRSHPSLGTRGGDWYARPIQGDFNATTDRDYFDFDPIDSEGLWPVYKGASFNLWEPDTGVYYAWVDPEEIVPVLQEKRRRSARRSSSPFTDFAPSVVRDPDSLPCWSPRIAFRDVTNRTNQRTVIACLVYPEVVITNQAPYLLWPKGDERDQAYVLGVLSSIPLDWYARRVVETHVNFHLFNAFPIPRPSRNDRHRRVVEQAAGRLAAVDDWFESWASAVGVEVDSVTDDERDGLIAAIDAAVAHLYGLSEDDLKVIFETFHVGWDYSVRLTSVVDQYRELA
jgi:hypothetical protein